MDPITPADLTARCQPIELLVADVDGVLTDGVIAMDDRRSRDQTFSRARRPGLRLVAPGGQTGGDPVGPPCRRPSSRRAAELKIAHVLQGHEQKAAPFQALIEGLGLSPHQVCFVGDDLPDLPVLRAVGLAACPADAVAEVTGAAHLITRAPGGRGAVREIVEVILKSQGKWNGR